MGMLYKYLNISWSETMSKLKKLLDKKKTNKPTPAVVKIEDQQKKEDDQNNFPSEFKEDQIDMIHNLQ